MLAIYAALVLLGLAHGQNVGPPAFSPEPPTDKPEKPSGPYYCQARCLASCLETFLAPSLEDCEKFCPPFEDSMPCPPDNAQCWQTCGVPRLPTDPPAPDSPDLAPSILGTDEDFDPFVIELTWSAVTNASLYIVEFFPQNRVAKQGESNFFQVMTTSLTYKVRKDDECIEYRGRVIAVNSYGISQPVNAYISAPLPSITPDNTQFAVRNMRRDPFNTEKIQVTIDYTLPQKWPLDDIDINGLRVSAVDCKGPLGVKSFGQLEMPGANVNPSYTAVIGKTPTTAIQLSFNDDMLKSDCFVQMRVSAISTRCNTTVDYEDDFGHAPGVDFRINCDTIPEACSDNSTGNEGNDETTVSDPPTELAPIPIPTSIEVDPEVVVPPLNPPGHMPPGIDEPSNGTVEGQDSDAANPPTPNPWPLFIIGQGNEGPVDIQPVPPVGRVSIVDLAPNGTDAMTMAVIPGGIFPPMCDLEMIDAQPSLSEMSSSVIDVKVLWLERQPLPPPPPASYFVIRYGPIIRRLVDDDREPNEIIPGYETIVRTGQASSEMPFLPDPTREINITGIQRSSLLKIQICAIYDPASEALIQWEFVNSRRIDLAAIEPFLDFEAPAASPSPMAPPPDMVPIDMVPSMDNNPGLPDNGDSDTSGIDFASTGGMGMPDMAPSSPTDPNTEGVDQGLDPIDVPVMVLTVEHKSTPMSYWMTVLTCLLLMILTLMLIFVFLRRMCVSRRHVKALHHLEKPMVIVTTPVKPCTIDTIKVPLP